MDLFTAGDRASYRQAFIDLHDSFGQDITVWKSAQEVVISTDGNFNGIIGGQPNEGVTYIPQSGVFKARIKYLTAQEVIDAVGLNNNDDQKIKINLGGVRVRVSGDAVTWLNESERITFNDNVHVVAKRDRPHGLFAPEYYDYILTRVP